MIVSNSENNPDVPCLMPGRANRKHRKATLRTKLTPPMIAKMWGVKCQKVLTWIRSGELKAIDVASRRGGRPRYLVDIQDLAAFERSREVCPRPLPQIKAKRRNSNFTEYF